MSYSQKISKKKIISNKNNKQNTNTWSIKIDPYGFATKITTGTAAENTFFFYNNNNNKAVPCKLIMHIQIHIKIIYFMTYNVFFYIFIIC